MNFWLLSVTCWLSSGVSVFLGLSSASLFTAWVALELNMVSFLGVLCSSRNATRESAGKYFVVQALSSSLFVSMVVLQLQSPSVFYLCLMALSLALKAGVAPLHGWFVGVSSDLGGAALVGLFTLQKLMPLALMLALSPPALLAVLCFSSAVIGLLGSVNQSNLSKLLAYSSVFSLAWALLSLRSLELLMLFMATYLLSLMVAVMASPISASAHVLEAHSVWNLRDSSPGLVVGLLSVGGLPPTVGFMGKLLILGHALSEGWWVSVVLVLVLSGAMMYLYLRLALLSVSGGQPQWGAESFSSMRLWGPAVLLLMPSGLLLILRASDSH